MTKLRTWCLMLILFGGSTACGKDDEEEQDKNGNVSVDAFLADCRAYCDASVANNCGKFATADTCKTQYCGSPPSTSALCAAAATAYGDCLEQQAAANVCGAQEACMSQLMKMSTDC